MALLYSRLYQHEVSYLMSKDLEVITRNKYDVTRSALKTLMLTPRPMIRTVWFQILLVDRQSSEDPWLWWTDWQSGLLTRSAHNY